MAIPTPELRVQALSPGFLLNNRPTELDFENIFRLFSQFAPDDEDDDFDDPLGGDFDSLPPGPLPRDPRVPDAQEGMPMSAIMRALFGSRFS